MNKKLVKVPAPQNITHAHILACVNTMLIERQDEHSLVRICDIGCGDGRLLSYLAACLPILKPTLTFHFCGLDVADSGVQSNGFFSGTLETLYNDHPEVDWKNNLHLITASSLWPFEDDSIDIVVSNQVLEHVNNHSHFFLELKRTLKQEGQSIHLFPLIHYFWEGHLLMPLVHRIKERRSIARFIKFMSRLGIGTYKQHRKKNDETIESFSERHADYMLFLTNYLTDMQLLQILKLTGLRATFRFTEEFYLAKLRQIIGKLYKTDYVHESLLLSGPLFFQFFKRISSITLHIEKKNIYLR
jgi:SAM-dependent methyltransferase